MQSIRFRLVFYLLTISFVGTVITGAILYFFAKEELTEYLDENLKEVAQIVADIENMNTNPNDSVRKALKTMEPHNEGAVIVSIWNNQNQLFYTSKNNIHFNLPKKSGFQSIDGKDDTWWVYVLKSKNMTVQVSQSIKELNEEFSEIIIAYFAILFFQILVLSILAWFAISHSLKPLGKISKGLKDRGPYSLQPFNFEHQPSEIQPVLKELNNLLGKLDHSLKFQRQFIDDASHELRTPLTALQLQLENLKRSDTQDARIDAEEKLTAGVKRCINLIRQMLRMARNDANINQPHMETIDLLPLIEEIVDEFQIQAQTKNIDLRFINENTKKAKITGDINSIRVLVECLIDNALLYTLQSSPEDNKPETINSGKIQVRLKPAAGRSIILSVSDNGIGIEPAKRTKVFDRFYRIGSSGGGSGLGLSIVKTIADTHKAEIRIDDGLNSKGISVNVKFRQ